MKPPVYVEREVAETPRARQILKRLAGREIVPIDRYGEIFNRKRQSFRRQKDFSSIILAKKRGRRVIETPEGYGLGGPHNYYFSHLLNCPYDCRYCFLQGMYRSAHYVVFVNHEDFFTEIEATLERHSGEPVWFFSGYDCDSLAFDAVTSFCSDYLPFFRRHDHAFVELRTKSANVEPILACEPWNRCVVAFSMTPERISEALEHRVPPLSRRLEAMERLATAGFPVALRFDPIIVGARGAEDYRELFRVVFERVPPEKIHSVSLGEFRMPRPFFRRLVELHPQEPLFARPVQVDDGVVSVTGGGGLRDEIGGILEEYVDASRHFPCS